MYQPLTDFGDIGSAAGSTSIGRQSMRNYEQGMDFANKGLQAEALYRANQYRNKVIEETGGAMAPQDPLSSGLSVANDLFKGIKGVINANNSGGGSGFSDTVSRFTSGPNYFSSAMNADVGIPDWGTSLNLLDP